MPFPILRFWFLRFCYAHACAAVEAQLRSLAEMQRALVAIKQRRDDIGRELDQIEAELEIATREEH